MSSSTERPGWAPDEVDLGQPSAARAYDYYLGGSHNFAVDRELAQKAMQVMPNLAQAAAANRGFLRRATQHLISQGVTQFLDIGSGIPTVGNTHEIAQRGNDQARVVYADLDPVAVIHSEAMLVDNDNAAIVAADLRKPAELLAEVKSTGLLDFERPIAVMLIAVLHFLSDDDNPYEVVGQLRDALAPGSYITISHATLDGETEVGSVVELYKKSPNPLRVRSREEFTKFFDGLTLLEPGAVFVPQWRPGPNEVFADEPRLSSNFGAVGQKA